MNERLWLQARQYILHTHDSASPLLARQLLANVVRATSERLDIRAGVDIAARAISLIADSADFVTATSLLIDRNTARSCNKNLKERVYVNEYVLMDMYRLGMSGGLKMRHSYHRMGHWPLHPQCTRSHWRPKYQHWRQWGRELEQNKQQWNAWHRCVGSTSSVPTWTTANWIPNFTFI